MSSRNRFLSPEERAIAPALHAALADAAKRLADGRTVAETLMAGEKMLREAGLSADYFALVHATSLVPLTQFVRPARLLSAARLGRIRLLDNVAVN